MRPVALCYNLKGTEKGRKLAMIFGFLGYRVRHVKKEEYGIPLDALAGGNAQEVQPDAGSAGDFTEEMLVLHAAGEEQLDQALYLMRKEKVQVDLKAVLTPTNREWDSLSLYREIRKEHEMMKQRETERKQND